MIEGNDRGNDAAQFDSLYVMTVSDANTAGLVDAGILHCLALTLSLGPEALAGRPSKFHQYLFPARIHPGCP